MLVWCGVVWCCYLDSTLMLNNSVLILGTATLSPSRGLLLGGGCEGDRDSGSDLGQGRIKGRENSLIIYKMQFLVPRLKVLFVFFLFT